MCLPIELPEMAGPPATFINAVTSGDPQLQLHGVDIIFLGATLKLNGNVSIIAKLNDRLRVVPNFGERETSKQNKRARSRVSRSRVSRYACI